MTENSILDLLPFMRPSTIGLIITNVIEVEEQGLDFRVVFEDALIEWALTYATDMEWAEVFRYVTDPNRVGYNTKANTIFMMRIAQKVVLRSIGLSDDDN